MKRVVVEVTAEDIEARNMSGLMGCPVALALQRAGFPEAAVGSSYWYPSRYHGDGLVLPSIVSDNIDRLLDGKPVAPFTFEVEA